MTLFVELHIWDAAAPLGAGRRFVAVASEGRKWVTATDVHKHRAEAKRREAIECLLHAHDLLVSQTEGCG